MILDEEEDRRQGLMSRLTVECSTCDNVEVLDTSASVSQRGTSFDINRRLVYSSNEMGGGYEGLATLCNIMNMPCMSKTAYYKQLESIILVLERECLSELKRVGEK